MKPINKPTLRRIYSPHGTAKEDLLHTVGEHCSYCERPGAAQDLHVEHIYPQKAHPSRSTQWDNFLVACNTCNTYKRNHLGDGRQRDLFKRYLWPHLDNTSNAFRYTATGAVDIPQTLPPQVRKAAELTREMCGLLRSPAKATGYQNLGIAYDGASRRSQAWSMAMDFKSDYIVDPSPARAAVIAKGASKMGHFSVWMEVFHDQPTMRLALIAAFKADANCFHTTTTAPMAKGRL